MPESFCNAWGTGLVDFVRQCPAQPIPTLLCLRHEVEARAPTLWLRYAYLHDAVFDRRHEDGRSRLTKLDLLDAENHLEISEDGLKSRLRAVLLQNLGSLFDIQACLLDQRDRRSYGCIVRNAISEQQCCNKPLRDTETVFLDDFPLLNDTITEHGITVTQDHTPPAKPTIRRDLT